MYCTSWDNEEFTSYNEMNNNKNNYEKNLCIICYEPESHANTLTYLKNIKTCLFICNCNILIHNDCFTKWFMNHASCPICRETNIQKCLVLKRIIQVS
jgi:hypothetical protein